MGREESGAKSVRMAYFATESVMGRVWKRGRPRREAAVRCTAGVGVKNRYEAELTNQRRGSGSKT